MGEFGYYFNSDTGYHTLRRREYNAGDGRFVSFDPLHFNAGDYNLYRYVLNFPLTEIDPSGLSSWLRDGDITAWKKLWRWWEYRKTGKKDWFWRFNETKAHRVYADYQIDVTFKNKVKILLMGKNNQGELDEGELNFNFDYKGVDNLKDKYIRNAHKSKKPFQGRVCIKVYHFSQACSRRVHVGTKNTPTGIVPNFKQEKTIKWTGGLAVDGKIKVGGLGDIGCDTSVNDKIIKGWVKALNKKKSGAICCLKSAYSKAPAKTNWKADKSITEIITTPISNQAGGPAPNWASGSD